MNAWNGGGYRPEPETVQAPTTLDTVSLFVPGVPVPQGSKKGFARGRFVNIVDDNAEKLKPWRATVARHADVGLTFSGPVNVDLIFYMLRPQRPRWDVPAVKPDIDKLARAVLDGLTDGGLIEDDARVIGLNVSKRYANDVDGPGVHVTVTA